MRIVSIDPGTSGALAFFGAKGRLDHTVRMPVVEEIFKKKNPKTGKITNRKRLRLDEVAIVRMVRAFDADRFIVEKVGVRPKQGVTSSGRFMEGFGILQGVAAGLDLVCYRVLPATWKRHFGLLGATKTGSRDLAKSMWPEFSDDFRLKKDDGRAEAALIGRFFFEK